MAGHINKVTVCDTQRHCLAMHLPGADYSIRTVQEMLCHADASTAAIYTHVLGHPAIGVTSPLDLTRTGD